MQAVSAVSLSVFVLCCVVSCRVEISRCEPILQKINPTKCLQNKINEPGKRTALG
jgi:hypothetical protein